MQRPETPFPRHWLYYIALKIVVLAGAIALVLLVLIVVMASRGSGGTTVVRG